MRRALTLLATAALALGACNDDDEPSADRPSTDVPTVAPPATTPTDDRDRFRQPDAGEGQLDVTGTVRDAEVRRISDEPSDLAQYQYFVIEDEQGPPLRVAAAGDLALDPPVRERLFAPRCAGKVRATFKVAPVARPAGFDYELLTARVLRDDC